MNTYIRDNLNALRDGTGIATDAITTPKISNPYRMRVHKASGNQTGVANDTWTTVTLDSEDFDSNNNFASNTYTAPVTGYYLVEASVYNALSAGNITGTGVRIIANGLTVKSLVEVDYDNGVSYDAQIRTLSDVIHLNQGDTIVLQVYSHITSGTGTIGASESTRMALHLLSED